MNLFLEYQKKIFKSLKALEKYKKINIPSTLKIINVDLPPRNQKADLACNAAMILARSNNTSPNLLAEKMRWMGQQRYNVASIIEVLKGKQRLAKLIIEGNTVVGDYGFILGCNTIHTGKGMKMAPLAQLNDGLIDLIIARKAGRIKLLTLFPKLFSGAHVGDPLVEYRQVKEFFLNNIYF